MDVWEVLLVAIGLSIDVFVVSAYMGAGFSKINKKNLCCLCLLFGGMQLFAIDVYKRQMEFRLKNLKKMLRKPASGYSIITMSF